MPVIKPENELAFIVAFYLAKFDMTAVHNLGFATRTQAFREIGSRLGVKASTIKQTRDQFDTLFDIRAGWHQRPLPPSRRKVVELFGAMSEVSLRSFVQDAINSRDFAHSSTGKELLHAVTGPVGKEEIVREPMLQRGATGRKAEEFFLKKFNAKETRFAGNLFDARDYGAGFDFQITQSISTVFVEVKGMVAAQGGIAFTDKEWERANDKGNDYFAALVSGIGQAAPKLDIIMNPAAVFRPKRYASTSVSVLWQVPVNQILPTLGK